MVAWSGIGAPPIGMKKGGRVRRKQIGGGLPTQANPRAVAALAARPAFRSGTGHASVPVGGGALDQLRVLRMPPQADTLQWRLRGRLQLRPALPAKER